MFCRRLQCTNLKRTKRKWLLGSIIVGAIFLIFLPTNGTRPVPFSNIVPCEDYTPIRHQNTRALQYSVLYNYFPATKRFRCNQSITYTTHGDWTYLDNLVPLLERWQGPVSITLYAPGTDFDESLKGIQYLRECIASNLVKELVTFHLFFDKDHVPSRTIPDDPDQLPVNCSALAGSVEFGRRMKTYRKRMKLLYPVNVGRNVARDMATTHYVFPSDIELYPNPNLVTDFLEMIRLNPTLRQQTPRKVFVLPIFEVALNTRSLPKDKQELLQMLQKKTAVVFHKYVCEECHRVPKYEEWTESLVLPGLRVFYVTKRARYWEPIYIGTKSDPAYDESLSWDGKEDKMAQAYALCLLDYEFHILDNGFLVHRPGIKIYKKELDLTPPRVEAMRKNAAHIYNEILPALENLYGRRANCHFE